MGYYNTHVYDEFYGTLAVDLGTYLKFGPVQLGLDWRPEWFVMNHSGSDVSFNVSLNARLALGRGRR